MGFSGNLFNDQGYIKRRGLSIQFEVINNTDDNIILTNTSIGTETVIYGRKFHQDEIGYDEDNLLIVRVTGFFDTSKTKMLNYEPFHKLDYFVRKAMTDKIKECLDTASYSTYQNVEYRFEFQVDIKFNPLSNLEFHESGLFSFHIRRDGDNLNIPSMKSPLGDLKRAFLPELYKREYEADGKKDLGIRAVSAIRLIDKESKIGNLWTNTFGRATKVTAVKTSPLKDGLYIAAGSCFEHVHYVPLDVLLEDKKLLEFGLFRTKKEALDNSICEYVKSVLTDNKDIRKVREVLIKENKSLTSNNETLQKKVSDLESELKIVKGESKSKITNLEGSKARAIDDLKSQNSHLSKMMEVMKTDHRREISELQSRIDWERRKTFEKHEAELKKLKRNSIMDTLGELSKVLAGLVGTGMGLMKLAALFK